MSRTSATAAVVLCVAVIAGCGGTSLLRSSSTTAPAPVAGSPAVSAYLGALARAQSRLAAAERAIPQGPHTAADFAAAVRQLGDAIGRLERDLAVVRPPPAVAALHRRLVGVVAGYGSALRRAERSAVAPGGLVGAGEQLLAATNRATRAFAATIGRIDAVLVKAPRVSQ